MNETPDSKDLNEHGVSASLQRQQAEREHSSKFSDLFCSILPAPVGINVVASFQQAERDGSRRAGITKRQREFRQGRVCAIKALRQVGGALHVDPFSLEAAGSEASSEQLTSIVGVGEDRCPIWPKGFVGSISHSQNWTFAVAASETALSGIGIDTEVILSPDTHEIVRPEVGTELEWNLLRERSLRPELETTLLFSVKETYFKLWYPRIRQFYNFDDVQLVQVADLQRSKLAPTEAPLSFHLHTRRGWTESGTRPDQQFVTRVAAFWTDEDVFSLAWWVPAPFR